MQPVHHRTRQSATASARSASRGSQKVCTVCVYMCAHVWLYVANPDEGGGGWQGPLGGIDQSTKAWCGAEQPATLHTPHLPFCGYGRNQHLE